MKSECDESLIKLKLCKLPVSHLHDKHRLIMMSLYYPQCIAPQKQRLVGNAAFLMITPQNTSEHFNAQNKNLISCRFPQNSHLCVLSDFTAAVWAFFCAKSGDAGYSSSQRCIPNLLNCVFLLSQSLPSWMPGEMQRNHLRREEMRNYDFRHMTL